MISIIKSLHRLIGQNGIRLVPSILLSMLDSVLNSCMYGVMLFVLIDLSNGQFSAEGLKMCRGSVSHKRNVLGQTFLINYGFQWETILEA